MKAAEKGDRSSVAQAGWNFVSGCGVAQDVARGIGMVHDAADMGESKAFYYLGMWHSEGVYGLERSRYLAKIYLNAHLRNPTTCSSHHRSCFTASVRLFTALERLKLLEHRICPVAKAIADEKNLMNPKFSIEVVEAMAAKRAQVVTARVVKRLLADVRADDDSVRFCRICAGSNAGHF